MEKEREGEMEIEAVELEHDLILFVCKTISASFALIKVASRVAGWLLLWLLGPTALHSTGLDSTGLSPIQFNSIQLAARMDRLLLL